MYLKFTRKFFNLKLFLYQYQETETRQKKTRKKFDLTTEPSKKLLNYFNEI